MKIPALNMELFKEQKAYIDKLEQELYDVFRVELQKNAFVVKNYVVERQLYQKGIDGYEKRLAGYSRYTIRYKISKGQPYDRTTLRDTGYFHGTITIIAKRKEFEITSSTSYDKYLVKRYGKAILLPSKRNMKEFISKFVLPALKGKFKND